MIQLSLYIIVAIVIGFIVAALFGFKVPGRLPGIIIAGLLGAWIGDVLIRKLGPQVGDYYIFPAALGAFVIALIISLLGRRARVYN
ncbi:MAG TPA: GlsB/YeaQ/YmgE family stress response membrane protein [Pseudogracilibacillus sp.]|nr:GlsB/YeaQ/YmgE family stress response membrane protein [Pseudogracilibacillus sp.]